MESSDAFTSAFATVTTTKPTTSRPGTANPSPAQQKQAEPVLNMHDLQLYLRSIDQSMGNQDALKRLRERVYDHNLTSGQKPRYEPLLDEGLADYFQAPHMQKHLKQLGLIEEDGTFVPDNKWINREALLRRDQRLRENEEKEQRLELDKIMHLSIAATPSRPSSSRAAQRDSTLEARASAYVGAIHKTAMVYLERQSPDRPVSSRSNRSSRPVSRSVSPEHRRSRQPTTETSTAALRPASALPRGRPQSSRQRARDTSASRPASRPQQANSSTHRRAASIPKDAREFNEAFEKEIPELDADSTEGHVTLADQLSVPTSATGRKSDAKQQEVAKSTSAKSSGKVPRSARAHDKTEEETALARDSSSYDLSEIMKMNLPLETAKKAEPGFVTAPSSTPASPSHEPRSVGFADTAVEITDASNLNRSRSKGSKFNLFGLRKSSSKSNSNADVAAVSAQRVVPVRKED